MDKVTENDLISLIQSELDWDSPELMFTHRDLNPELFLRDSIHAAVAMSLMQYQLVKWRVSWLLAYTPKIDLSAPKEYESCVDGEHFGRHHNKFIAFWLSVLAWRHDTEEARIQ